MGDGFSNFFPFLSLISIQIPACLHAPGSGLFQISLQLRYGATGKVRQSMPLAYPSVPPLFP